MVPRKFKICDAFGIPVYADFSLVILLLIFISDAPSIEFGVATAILLALSITAHELGHALTARAFGYATRDITLSLLGGCASLIALPKKAWQEFLTAIAGPLVSFALAALGYAVLAFVPGLGVFTANLFGYLWLMNTMLGAFNLLPGFPMDGGRIFRSVARLFASRARATYWAMVVGRAAAILLVAGPMIGIRHIWFIPIGGYFFMRVLIAWMIWREGYREYLLAVEEERYAWRDGDFVHRVSPPPYDE